MHNFYWVCLFTLNTMLKRPYIIWNVTALLEDLVFSIRRLSSGLAAPYKTEFTALVKEVQEHYATSSCHIAFRHGCPKLLPLACTNNSTCQWQSLEAPIHLVDVKSRVRK